MSGNGRLSDYIAAYDQRKKEEADKLREAADRGVALAAQINSRIDIALDKGGLEGSTYVYSVNDENGARRQLMISPNSNGTVRMQFDGAGPKGSTVTFSKDYSTADEALREIALFVRTWVSP